jgi:hypothetical protein
VSEIAADDENVRCAATLVAPIVDVICTILNVSKKIETRISKTTVAPQRVKNSAIHSHLCEDTSDPCSAEDTFSDGIVCDNSPVCAAHDQLFQIEKVADIGGCVLSKQTESL